MSLLPVETWEILSNTQTNKQANSVQSNQTHFQMFTTQIFHTFKHLA